MKKTIQITIKGTDIRCIAAVPYSNCIRLEFFDESKQIFETGFKSEHLGIELDPFGAMQTIETTVVAYMEQICGCSVEAVVVDNLFYSEDDLRRQLRWKAFLTDEDQQEIKPKFLQLSLF